MPQETIHIEGSNRERLQRPQRDAIVVNSFVLDGSIHGHHQKLVGKSESKDNRVEALAMSMLLAIESTS